MFYQEVFIHRMVGFGAQRPLFYHIEGGGFLLITICWRSSVVRYIQSTEWSEEVAFVNE